VVHLAIQLMIHPSAPNFQWWGVIVCLLTDFLIVHLAVHLIVHPAVFRVDFAGVDEVIWVVEWVVVCMVEWGIIRCTTAC
jgi:hypothetical protein